MSHPDDNFDDTPEILDQEQALVLATALAQRTVEDNVAQLAIRSEMRGEEHRHFTKDDLMAERLGLTTLILAHLEDPTRTIDSRERVDTLYADGGYERTARGWRSIDANHFERITERTHITQPPESVQFERAILRAAEISRVKDAALAVARERQLTPEAVIIDDALYREVRQRVWHREELARIQARRIVSVGRQFAIYARNVVDTATDEWLQSFFAHTQTGTREELLHFVLTGDVAARHIEATREIFRQVYIYDNANIWGSNPLDSLPDQLRDILTPRRELVPTVQAAVDQADTV